VNISLVLMLETKPKKLGARQQTPQTRRCCISQLCTGGNRAKSLLPQGKQGCGERVGAVVRCGAFISTGHGFEDEEPSSTQITPTHARLSLMSVVTLASRELSCASIFFFIASTCLDF
jgi:hypothetical protein